MEGSNQTLEEDKSYLKKLMLMDSLQERKMWTSIATLDLQTLQDCFSNSKYWYFYDFEGKGVGSQVFVDK